MPAAIALDLQHVKLLARHRLGATVFPKCCISLHATRAPGGQFQGPQNRVCGTVGLANGDGENQGGSGKALQTSGTKSCQDLGLDFSRLQLTAHWKDE